MVSRLGELDACLRARNVLLLHRFENTTLEPKPQVRTCTRCTTNDYAAAAAILILDIRMTETQRERSRPTRGPQLTYPEPWKPKHSPTAGSHMRAQGGHGRYRRKAQAEICSTKLGSSCSTKTDCQCECQETENGSSDPLLPIWARPMLQRACRGTSLVVHTLLSIHWLQPDRRRVIFVEMFALPMSNTTET